MTRNTGTAPATPAVELPSPKERRRLREAKALSQAQVAEIVGVTRETVRSWELGRTSPRGRKRDLYARLLATITTELTTTGQATPVRTPNPPAESTPPATPTTPAAAPSPAPGSPLGRRNAPAPGSPLGRRGRPPGAERAGKGAAPGGAEPPAPAPPGTAPAHPDAATASRTAPAQPPTATASRTAKPDTSQKRLRPRTTKPTKAPAEANTATEAEAGTGTGAESPLTPTEAFDHLYSRTAPSLLRQAYLLTGRHRLSHESVERAFHLAWQRWPEVATDGDPAGWVRAAAYEYAMSPWHRLRPSHRHIDPPQPQKTAAETPDPQDLQDPQAPLLEALLQLPPPYRRTLVLYDGLGLDLPETAAETEATTPAAAHRLEHARTVVAQKLPELAEPRTPAEQSALMQERLSTLAAAQPVDALPTGDAVRTRSERKTRFWTRAAIAFTTLIIGATSFTLATAPTRYEPPIPPGERVGGVPARSGPQRLDAHDKQLRAKLRAEPENGPQRLVPQGR
ncbi:hypothetical protein GCM10010329_05330 [Streptomyces spiroverticillatus]|uniref:HTH cro/C1-type domain-containing protein n=1 Tax=Streptomyces finlayi TaxID=67296 RepID=A0A919C7G0_9ACTN|nr:helix-turn-helix domain-containing protein [Streptomyces finlayi]GGZ88165.1 hypothetical protein GCM10010329_05330 [Streptomyces spiroverticillatus]GHC79230.1 hypothetical protein GCM10010334_05310 [Streptomyces finlayi]